MTTTTTKINGYNIQYNDYWNVYQVSYEDIGSGIAEFNTIEEAIEYAKKG